MTREQDREDLARHEAEIAAHESFNYALFDDDETALQGGSRTVLEADIAGLDISDDDLDSPGYSEDLSYTLEQGPSGALLTDNPTACVLLGQRNAVDAQQPQPAEQRWAGLGCDCAGTALPAARRGHALPRCRHGPVQLWPAPQNRPRPPTA